MKKLKELIIKIFKNKISRIVSIVGIIVIILFVFFLNYNKKEKLDTKYLITTLEKASELTTAKLNYTGMSEFEDQGIAIINRSDFIMVYQATARAGIDVKEVKINVDNINNIVWLTIPKAKILEVKVDPKSIKYFDEKFSLFNFNDKEDANEANALAEEKAKEELSNMGVLEMADSQSEALIKGLLQDVVPKEYEIKIKKWSQGLSSFFLKNLNFLSNN